MKKYSEYTTEEIDVLYEKLSETAQDFIFSGETKNQVEIIGKKVGLPIDKWETLDNLTIETILGVCPAALYQSEIIDRLDATKEQTEAIVKHMDAEIFSSIRDEELESYDKESGYNVEQDGVIFDNSQEELKNDPYKEELGGVSAKGAEIITPEKLHIVDELFSNNHTIPREGAHILHSDIPAPNPLIITRETIEKMDGLNKAKESPVSQEKPLVEIVPEVAQAVDKKQVTTLLPDGKVFMRFEKSTTPGKVHVVISRTKRTEDTKKELPKETLASTTVPQKEISTPSYSKDPYRELL